MTQEEKQLLLKDLCARLPYGVICNRLGQAKKLLSVSPYKVYCLEFDNGKYKYKVEDIKPYLRPISSMTEEEFINLTTVTELQYDQLELVEWDNCKTLEFYLSEVPHYCVIKVFDWLNAHHFDYCGLIEQGLALEAPEGMYKTE